MMKNKLCALFALSIAWVVFSAEVGIYAEEETETAAVPHAQEQSQGHSDGGHSDDPTDEHSSGHAHDLGHGNAGASLNDPGEFRTDLAIYTFVVFVLLLLLLGKLAWPSIAAALLEREKRIEASIADAEAMNAEAKDMLAQHEAKLATAADQVRELLEEARRDAEGTKTQILAEAKKLADQERERAVRDVERAADHAVQSLAESSANMAVELAGKVVQQNITADQQASLVREALSKFASSSPSKN